MAVKKFSIAVIHGPNLNLLGLREPEVYGHTTLEGINSALSIQAKEAGVELKTLQSNHEGEIIDFIQAHRECDGILINPAALTHTSVGLRDVLLAVTGPIVEVHLSNIFAREDFRKHSLISDIAKGVIVGFAGESYTLGLLALVKILKTK